MNDVHLGLVAVMAVASCGGSVVGESASGATGTGASGTGASGGGWVDRAQGTNAARQLWTAVASDSTGTHLVAASTIVIPPGSFVDGVWTSPNAGLTWTVASTGRPRRRRWHYSRGR